MIDFNDPFEWIEEEELEMTFEDPFFRGSHGILHSIAITNRGMRVNISIYNLNEKSAMGTLAHEAVEITIRKIDVNADIHNIIGGKYDHYKRQLPDGAYDGNKDGLPNLPLFESPKKRAILRGAKGESMMQGEACIGQTQEPIEATKEPTFLNLSSGEETERENLVLDAEAESEHHLYRIFMSDYNDRREVGRVKALESQVESGELMEWLKKSYIKPEGQDMIEEHDDGYNFGISVMNGSPEECKENAHGDCQSCIHFIQYECVKEHNIYFDINCKDYEFDEDNNPCEYCDLGCDIYIMLERIEEPEPSDYSYRTIFGGNDYFDITSGEEVKAEDWDARIVAANQKDPQLGVAALLLSSATPREALSDELAERSRRELEEARL